MKDNIKQEERKRKQIEKGLADDRKTLGAKENNLEGMQGMFDALRQEDEQCQAALKTAQDRYQAISLGQFTSESGESATLQEQIMQAKKEISAAETEIKTADMKIKDNTEQLKKKQLEMKKTEAEYKRDSGSLGRSLYALAFCYLLPVLRSRNYFYLGSGSTFPPYFGSGFELSSISSTIFSFLNCTSTGTVTAVTEEISFSGGRGRH